MENILNLFGRLFNLKSINEGYVGLTSFEKPKPDRIKRPQLPEVEEEPITKTSFTGLLRRAN